MNWNEVRKHYPDRWLLLEATEAHSESSRRVVDDMSIISSFSDSELALKEYMKLHREDSGREFYIAHTSHEVLEIQERKWLGVRAAA